ncbi:TPA: DUF1015 family protein [archaeon]|nr:DUF1015 family protein [Candidatus Naiadarchaeales archaeon SRR2090159.bin1288]
MEILERFDDGTVIALIEIGKLHDHEQIKPQHLDELCDEIKKDGEVKYPIIVDKYSNVVLDGHHRFYALQRLGCKYAPAHIVDYYSGQIKVERWHPLVKTRREAKAVLKLLGKEGYKVEEVLSEDVLNVVLALGQACVGFVLENHDEEFFMAYKEGATYGDAMKVVKDALEAEGKQKEIEHVGEESEALRKLKTKEARMAIITPPMTKEKVVATAETGKPMPPKSTRHIMPEKKYYPVSLSDLMK